MHKFGCAGPCPFTVVVKASPRRRMPLAGSVQVVVGRRSHEAWGLRNTGDRLGRSSHMAFVLSSSVLDVDVFCWSGLLIHGGGFACRGVARCTSESGARCKDDLHLGRAARLEPMAHEMERMQQPLVVVAHQAILRVLYCYLMELPRESCPQAACIPSRLHHVSRMHLHVPICDGEHQSCV